VSHPKITIGGDCLKDNAELGAELGSKVKRHAEDNASGGYHISRKGAPSRTEHGACWFKGGGVTHGGFNLEVMRPWGSYLFRQEKKELGGRGGSGTRTEVGKKKKKCGRPYSWRGEASGGQNCR